MGLVCIQNSSLLVYSKSQKVSASYCLPFQHSRGKNQPVPPCPPPPSLFSVKLFLTRVHFLSKILLHFRFNMIHISFAWGIPLSSKYSLLFPDSFLSDLINCSFKSQFSLSCNFSNKSLSLMPTIYTITYQFIMQCTKITMFSKTIQVCNKIISLLLFCMLNLALSKITLHLIM